MRGTASKRLLSLLLALVMVVSLMPAAAIAEEAEAAAEVSAAAADTEDGETAAAVSEESSDAEEESDTEEESTEDESDADSSYNHVIYSKEYAISPGVTETNVVLNDSTGGNQNKCYYLSVDLTNENATLMASYSNMDVSVPQTQVMTKQAAAAEEKYGVNVVGAINTNLSWTTNNPLGMLVVNGEVWHEELSAADCYLVLYKDNTAEIRSGTEPLDGTEWQAVSGFGWLVQDGVSVYPTEDHNVNNRAPRTAIGVKEDGSLVLFVVDGRQAPASTGMTLNELAEEMIALGCVNAMNCDGGGSSTFISEREGSGELTIKNSPSDGAERATLGGLLVISTATPTGTFDHASVSPGSGYYTPGSTIEFSAVGVDSSGGTAELPEGVTWSLADESADLGTIDASTGVFQANSDAVGVVTVNLMNDGEIVGTGSIELVTPDEIYFNNDELSLGFGETVDFGLAVKYKDLDVNYKDGDLVWTLSDEALGSFEGNVFTSSDSDSIEGTVTVASAFDSTVQASIKLIVGKLPTVVWDFEDQTAEDGTVISAEDYYTGENGILTHSNYNRGGNESIEIVSIDDGEPVRLGSHSLKLNYDFTNCGAVIEGACVGTIEAMEVPGTPTAIGVWVYAPEDTGITWEGDGTTSGFWLRGYITDGNGATKAYDFTLEPKSCTGDDQPGIYWTGWKYCEADLSSFTAPYSIQAGMTFRLMYVYNTSMGTKTAGAIYFDNLQFVYGTNIDDVDSPVISSVLANRLALSDGDVLTTNTISFVGQFYDVQNKYTSGIDADTARIYIDGVNTYDNENFNFVISSGENQCDLGEVTLLNGEHSITVSVRDKSGNETSETLRFTVDGDEELTQPTVGVTALEDSAVLGGTVDLQISASDASTVESNTTEIKVAKAFADYTVSFSDNYEGTSSYNKTTGVITVSATRKTDESAEDNVIATVSVAVPSDTNQNASFTYEVKSGQYTVSDGTLLTYSAAEETLPVSAAYTVGSDTIIVGAEGTLIVTASDGTAASGVGVYLYDETSAEETLLGTSDENGEVKTSALSESAGDYVVFAKDDSGKRSFHTTIRSYTEQGTEEPYNIIHNATANGSTEESFSWMTAPSVSGQQLKYAEDGTDTWTTVDASSTILTFTKDGNSAAAVHSVYLTDLKQGTAYRYCVGSDEGWSEELTFTTGVDDSDTDFFVIGDIQAEDLTNITNILSKVSSGYDFGIQTGDSVDDATSYTSWSELVKLFSTDSIGDTDMIHVLGNHEFAGDADASSAAAIYGLSTKGMGSCYSVTYDNVYVAVINYTGNKTQLSEALEWLKEDAAASDAQWKILSMHQPAYYTNTQGGNAEIQELVPSVMDEVGIDFVFSGHDHAYARTEPLEGGEVNEDEGTVYFIAGSSGEKSYSVTDNEDFHFAKVSDDYNAVYLKVSATDKAFTVVAYDVLADGTEVEIDRYYKELAHDYVVDGGTIVCSICGNKPSGVVETDDGVYYAIEGALSSGWHTDLDDSSIVYYFSPTDYAAVDGEQTIDGYDYVFENCVLVRGDLVTDSNGTRYMWAGSWVSQQWYTVGGNKYYFRSSYYAATGLYAFNVEGANVFYLFDENGVWQEGVSGIYDVGEYTYLFENGIMVNYPGLVEIDGDYYYFAYYPYGDESKYAAIKDRTYWISKTNGLMAEGSYTFDEEGKMVLPDTTKNGIVEENGSLYYYEDGVLTYAGLIYIDGDYYYVRTSGEVVHGRSYWITKTNGLMAEKSYTFADDGKMIKNGIVPENDSLYYYVDGVLTYAGLIEIDGSYYYVRTSGEVVHGRSYWITKTNGLMGERSYTFDDDGKMVDPAVKDETKNGIVEENGSLYYYVDGVLTYAGLVEIDGSYYYVRTSGEVVHGRSYWITKTNGLMAEKSYTFADDGKMITD